MKIDACIALHEKPRTSILFRRFNHKSARPVIDAQTFKISKTYILINLNPAGNCNFASIMQKKLLLLIGLLFSISFGSPTVFAQQADDEKFPILNPEAELLLENGLPLEEPVVLAPGDSHAGAAPLEFRFAANPASATANLRFEWQFAHDAKFDNLFLTRFDEETSYTFTQTGTHYIRVLCTNVDTEAVFESDAFVVQVTESTLKVPNAFSPNGDGVNDVFKVEHSSLVRFNATVFNRWGQELYRWSLANIDEGWDGTAHGKQVKEGVYFIVVEAEGADGVIYKHKGDINILR